MTRDEEYANRFRDTLQAVPVPPSRVDLGAAVRAGRRRERVYRLRNGSLAVAGGVAVAVLSVAVVSAIRTTAAPTGPATVSPDGPCTVRALPAPSWTGQPPSTGVTDIDPSGRYVAGYSAYGMTGRALLWVDGQVRILDAPGEMDRATAVNSAGTVVGYSAGGGWVYRYGQFTRLPALPGYPPAAARPVAINTRGDIVGQSGEMAVIWPAHLPGEVRAVGDGPATATGVSDVGLIVGHVGDHEGRLWMPDGTEHFQPRGFESRWIAGEWVVGEVGIARGGRTNREPHAYVLWNWTTDAKEWLHVPVDFVPTDVGESGAVVVSLNPDQTARPALLRDGTVIELPMPADRRSESVERPVVSGDGRTIAAAARSTDAHSAAAIWRC
jgi:hypothetical protein